MTGNRENLLEEKITVYSVPAVYNLKIGNKLCKNLRRDRPFQTLTKVRHFTYISERKRERCERGEMKRRRCVTEKEMENVVEVERKVS